MKSLNRLSLVIVAPLPVQAAGLRKFIAVAGILVIVLFGGLLRAETVINFAPGAEIHAIGVSQPQLSAMAYDGAGSIITDSGGTPIIFDPYIDTGASSFVISYMTARGYTMTDLLGGVTTVPGLGIDGAPPGEFIGYYTDYGIGGDETGDVTSPTAFGMMIRNGTPLTVTIELDEDGFPIIIPPEINPAEFTDHGSYSLWVRRQEGYGERTQLFGFDIMVQPLNVVGMTVIEKKVLVMDPTTIGVSPDGLNITPMSTYLLPKGSAVPSTNMAFDLTLYDFTQPLPPGETYPSYTTNPMFDNVSVSFTDGGGQTLTSTENSWLLDTGSSASMVGFEKAKEIGMIDNAYETFDAFMADFSGITLPVAGIGNIDSATEIPILQVDEIRIPDADGNDVVWKNVYLAVVDIPGLDGVFGMNMLLPASTIDLGTLTEIGNNPGYFDAMVFETTGAQTAKLSLLYNPILLPGDANGDGVVSADDYGSVQVNFGDTGVPGIPGDATGDGMVSADDYGSVQANFGDTGEMGSVPVPEPATMVLLTLGALGLLTRRPKL